MKGKAVLLRSAAARLVDFEIWVVALMAGLSALSARFLPVAVSIIILFWCLRWLATGRLGKVTPLDVPVIFLVILGLVNLWVTSLPEKTLPQVLRLFVGIGLCYSIVHWAITPQRLRWGIFGCALCCLALSAMAPFSVQWAIEKVFFIPASVYSRFTTLLSDVIHPNVMAGSLVILFPLVLAWLLFDWRNLGKIGRLFLAMVCLLTLGMVVLTQSRGSWLGLGVAVLVLIALRFRRGWLALAICGAAALGVCLVVGPERVLNILASSSTVSGFNGRAEVWSRAVYMIQDFPFTGIGMGLFGNVSDVMYPLFNYAPGAIPHAHNLYLQVAVDLGIPGLVSWLAILILVVLVSWRTYRVGNYNQDSLAASLGAGAVCSSIALIIHGCFDAVIWGMVRSAPILWGVWGLAIAGGIAFLSVAKARHSQGGPAGTAPGSGVS